MMEKTFRVLGDEEEGSSHSHTHSHSPPEVKSSASGVSTEPNGELRSRKKKENGSVKEASETEVIHKTSKLSAYLNLFGDFTHNMFV